MTNPPGGQLRCALSHLMSGCRSPDGTSLCQRLPSSVPLLRQDLQDVLGQPDILRSHIPA